MRRKKESNLKGRTYRKSRKSSKCKTPQSLSSDPLELNVGINKTKRNKGKFPKHMLLDIRPSYMTSKFDQNYIDVISSKATQKNVEIIIDKVKEFRYRTKSKIKATYKVDMTSAYKKWYIG